MLIEIERNSWENYINIINYYCIGKKATLMLWEKGKKKILAKNQEFLSIETYFHGPYEMMLAVIMGNDTEVSLGYFIKNLSKMTLDKDLLRSVKKVEIFTGKERKFVLTFNVTPEGKISKRATVYHDQISVS